MNTPLREFFEVMTPYYQGRSSLSHVESVLGESRSGPTRMEFYRRLMAANRRRILKQVLPALHRVWESRTELGLAHLEPWSDMVEAYAERHPARGFDPNEFARELPDWLAERQSPELMIEVARWSWRLLECARTGDEWHGALHASVAAELYPFDVALWLKSFNEGRRELPVMRPIVLITHFDRASQRVRILRPSGLELGVLARAAGEDLEESLEAARPNAREALARLTSLGLLREVEP